MDGAGAARLTPAPLVGPTDDDLDRLVRAAGLRATAARRRVLDALGSLGGHRTADEVLSSIRAAGRPIARASVFNALRDLSACGLVLVVEVPGAARYELAGTGHHHFVCRSCGTVIDVESTTGATGRVAPVLPGAEIDEATLLFRGRCPPCVASRAT